MSNRNKDFGSRRVYYNNFASHLLNAYNPNMLYPDLPHRWTDDQWFACLDMVESFGFNAFEFWLEPRLFCREGLSERYGLLFAEQMDRVIDYAHRKGLDVFMLCSLATSGSSWQTLCPNVPEEWDELLHIWESWLRRLNKIDVLALFPGDPGACSLNGCTAETYIDRSCDIANLAAQTNGCEVEFGTWGPPIFGWGIIEGPADWNGEFCAGYQNTAWKFDSERMNRSMEHLLRRLPDFPDNTSVAMNLGFGPDGNPGGDDDARRWIDAVAETQSVHSWDFSLTEGENAITPHWRFDRLFERRREERNSGAISGGICFTMTPLLNQLSLFESARSFAEPDADPDEVAVEFFVGLFGNDASELPSLYKSFEIIDDWGYYSGDPAPTEEIHRKAGRMAELLIEVTARDPASQGEFSFFPDVEAYRREILFYAELYRDLTAPAPDYDELRGRFWNKIYAIYDELPEHVDPRPRMATDRFIKKFSERATGS